MNLLLAWAHKIDAINLVVGKFTGWLIFLTTLISAGNALVRKIPIVRTVYDTIHRFVDLVSKKDDNDMKSMQPVWCHFGGQGGAAALALLSSPEPVMVNGVASFAVIIPTAPVPIGGGLLYVPKEWITPAEVGMEALTSLYVSMGVTSPQYLPKA